MKTSSLAIFGGSFDPPHNAHVVIVQKALEKLDIQKVLVVPSYLNPFKTTFNAPPALRCAWMEKVFADDIRVSVEPFEIVQNRPVPTIETIKDVLKRFNPQKIYLIIGADNLAGLDKWHKIDELKKLVEITVAKRGNVAIPSEFAVLDICEDISSTKIRDEKYLDSVPSCIREEVEKFYFKEKS